MEEMHANLIDVIRWLPSNDASRNSGSMPRDGWVIICEPLVLVVVRCIRHCRIEFYKGVEGRRSGATRLLICSQSFSALAGERERSLPALPDDIGSLRVKERERERWVENVCVMVGIKRRRVDKIKKGKKEDSRGCIPFQGIEDFPFACFPFPRRVTNVLQNICRR